jgi:hypothetical protein
MVEGQKSREAKELGEPNEEVLRHLLEAIARVRRDVEMVEFWADAVAGFVQPVPEYDQASVKIWMPFEQARGLRKNAG